MQLLLGHDLFSSAHVTSCLMPLVAMRIHLLHRPAAPSNLPPASRTCCWATTLPSPLVPHALCPSPPPPVTATSPPAQTCGPEQPSPSFAHLLLGYDVSPSARGVEDSILLPRAEFSVLTAIEKVRTNDRWAELHLADPVGGLTTNPTVIEILRSDTGCWGWERISQLMGMVDRPQGRDAW